MSMSAVSEGLGRGQIGGLGGGGGGGKLCRWKQGLGEGTMGGGKGKGGQGRSGLLGMDK